MTRFKGDFPKPQRFANAHNASVSKLQITSSCYLLNAFHPDLTGD